MTKKLAVSPDISYMLGICNCNKTNISSISIVTASNEMIERFVRISASLGTKAENMKISKVGRATTATIANSKLKKLLNNALEERDRIFKYKNEYSASYFAAMFDCNGASDSRGIFIRMGPHDSIILERIGFHTTSGRGRCYIRNALDFMMFIAPFSIKAKVIHLPKKL